MEKIVKKKCTERVDALGRREGITRNRVENADETDSRTETDFRSSPPICIFVRAVHAHGVSSRRCTRNAGRRMARRPARTRQRCVAQGRVARVRRGRRVTDDGWVGDYRRGGKTERKKPAGGAGVDGRDARMGPVRRRAALLLLVARRDVRRRAPVR